jgi:hypothetical protein
MGLDLTLIPFDCDTGVLAFSHTVLTLDRYRELFEDIGLLNQLPIPAKFHSFCGRHLGCDEPGYGQTEMTPYGEPIKCVLAGDLVKIGGKHLEKLNRKTLGVFAYLACLDADTKVALYWH